MAALCLLCCVACTPQKDTPKKLKVLSWNVWHGGHSKTYPGKGCEGTVGILKKSGADVVLMVETYGCRYINYRRLNDTDIPVSLPPSEQRRMSLPSRPHPPHFS